MLLAFRSMIESVSISMLPSTDRHLSISDLRFIPYRFQTENDRININIFFSNMKANKSERNYEAKFCFLVGLVSPSAIDVRYNYTSASRYWLKHVVPIVLSKYTRYENGKETLKITLSIDIRINIHANGYSQVCTLYKGFPSRVELPGHTLIRLWKVLSRFPQTFL